MRSQNKKSILLGGLVLVITIFVLGACKIDPNTIDPDPNSIPALKLGQAWKVDNAYPGYLPLGLYGNKLLVPHTRDSGLLMIDASTGTVQWRLSQLFSPESNAVLYQNSIYIIAYFSDIPGIYLVWIDVDGTYKGRIKVGSQGTAEPCLRKINLVDHYIFWSDRGSYTDSAGNIWRFDISQPLARLGPSDYSASAEGLKVFYHVPQAEGVAVMGGGTVLGIEDDIVFTYSNCGSTNNYEAPTQVVRLDAASGAVVWTYDTAKARNFWENDLALYQDKLVVSGGNGIELIEVADPGVRGPYWAFDDTAHQYFSGLTIVEDTAFFTSGNSSTAVSAYSLDSGARLWVLPNTTSAGQPAQYHKGILYVSEQEGVLAVDTAKGMWVGRDNNYPGYVDQVSTTAAYEDLFIFFSNQINTKGCIVAVKMDVQAQ